MGWPVPTPRLVIGAAAAGLLLLLVGDLGTTTIAGLGFDTRFVVLNLVLVALAVGDFLLAVRPASVLVERRHPTAITIGHEANIEWEATVELRRARRVRVWLADELAPSLGADTRRVFVDIPANGTGLTRTRLRPERRGRFEPADLAVRTVGPLGLVHQQRRRSLETQLRVLPPFRSAKEAELSLRQARILEVGLRSAKGRGGGTDFDSLRELTPDDETRRIDWAASARTGRTIVRTYRAERNQTVLCVLDAGRVMAGRIAGIPRLEYGMDGAMLMAELATGLGDRMGLVAFDREVHTTVNPSNRRSQRSVVTEALFDLQPALAESDYQGMVAHVLARHRRRAFLTLITDLSEEAVHQFLLPTLPLLIRTHLVVVASVRDPQIDQWSSDTNGDIDGAFLRSSAIAAAASRRRTAAVLRAKGAVVIDALPSEFAKALGDAYLDAKAAGRL